MSIFGLLYIPLGVCARYMINKQEFLQVAMELSLKLRRFLLNLVYQ